MAALRCTGGPVLGWLLLAMLSLLAPAAGAQTLPPCTGPTGCNLLANPSFEGTIDGNCPNDYATFGHRPSLPPYDDDSSSVGSSGPGNPSGSNVCGWHNGGVGTADLFNSCAPANPGSGFPRVGVPCNFATLCNTPGTVGGQPARTGNGYAGIIAFTSDTDPSTPYEYREYLAQNVALTAGKQYYAEFYSSIGSHSGKALASGLGMGFSNSALPFAGSGPAPFGAFFSGATGAQPGWQRVAGIFTATGLEQQAVIGYFGPGYGSTVPYNTPVVPGPAAGQLLPSDSYNSKAYYFVEDVLLQPIPTAGPNRSTACSTPLTLGEGCALPASASATYTWSPATGLNDPHLLQPTFTGTTPGSYTYTLTVHLTGQSSYSAGSVTTVTVTPTMPPVAVAVPGAVQCLGSPIVLTATGGDGINYTWSPATGLSATTGSSVIVTAGAGGVTTYTVTSDCAQPAIVKLTVKQCCRLDQASTPPIDLVSSEQAPYTSSPFGASAAVYHAVGDLYLQNDLYQLPPGSQLLMDAGASVYLSDQGRLEVNGALLTAACDDMWNGVWVRPTAGYVQTRAIDTDRAAVEHSLYGIVLEETTGGQTPPAFSFSKTDFRQNRQSIEIQRVNQPAQTDDFIHDCTFDSDPDAFLAPLRTTNPYQKVYSQQHVLLSGDARAESWKYNDFKHAMYGIRLASPYGWVDAFENHFSECYAAGLGSGDISTGADDPLGLSAQTFATRNVFQLPLQQPNTSQRATALNSSLPQGSFGILLPIQTLRAEYNTFEQTDASPYLKYDFERYREPQIGIYAGLLKVANNNTFTSLAAGIKANVGTGEEIEIRGNLFTECERGEWLLPYYYAGSSGSLADPVVFTSCNTFTGTFKRGGVCYGILVEDNPGNTGATPGLTFDDIYNLNGTAKNGVKSVLKDFFDTQYYGGGNGYFAIANTTTSLLSYLTFTGYANLYRTWSSPITSVDIKDVGFSVSPAQMGGHPESPCKYEIPNFPDTGIQQRPAGTVALSSNLFVSHTKTSLAQNVPNPAVGSTVVAYHLPAGTQHASLLMQRGLDGTVMHAYELRVTAHEYLLSLRDYQPGIYFYTLVIDGVPVQTKRLSIE